MAGYWPWYGLLFAGMVAQSALQVSLPLWAARFVDEFTALRDGSLVGIAGAFLLTVVLRGILTLGTASLATRLGWRCGNRLRRAMAAKLMQAPLAYHRDHNASALADRVETDAKTLQNAISGTLGQLSLNGMLVILILLALIGVDWRIGLVAVAIVLGSLFGMDRLRETGIARWSLARTQQSAAFGLVGQVFADPVQFRALGVVGYVVDLLHHRFDSLRKARVAATRLTQRHLPIRMAVAALLYGEAIGLGSLLVMRGDLTVGSALAALYYAAMLEGPIATLVARWAGLQNAEAAAQRVLELIDTPPGRIDFTQDTNAMEQPPARLAESVGVEIESLVFAYGNDKPVLNGITLSIAPAEHLVLTGRTGSGKSTLARLILGLETASAGQVTLTAGQRGSVRRVPAKSARLAYVAQNPVLLDGTVRENLCVSYDAATRDRGGAVLKDVGLSEWCRHLPLGLETPLTPNLLSLGEQRLFAIARAMLLDPNLCVLDEPLADLDGHAARRVCAAIQSLSCTTIVVSHVPIPSDAFRRLHLAASGILEARSDVEAAQ